MNTGLDKHAQCPESPTGEESRAERKNPSRSHGRGAEDNWQGLRRRRETLLQSVLLKFRGMGRQAGGMPVL